MFENSLVKSSKEVNLICSYDRDGISIKYGRATIAVVFNPYIKEYEIAVKPYYKNSNGEWVEMYSFEDDMKYNECMRIMAKCEDEGRPYPVEEQSFVEQLLVKKNYLRNQANAYVLEQSKLKDVETGYGMNKWREFIIESKDAVNLLEDFLKK